MYLLLGRKITLTRVETQKYVNKEKLKIVISTSVSRLDGRRLTFDGRVDVFVKTPYIQTIIEQQLMLHGKE